MIRIIPNVRSQSGIEKTTDVKIPIPRGSELDQ